MRLIAATLILEGDGAVGHGQHKLEQRLAPTHRLSDLARRGAKEEWEQLQRRGLADSVRSVARQLPRNS